MVNKQITVTGLLLVTLSHWCDGNCATDEFRVANSICCRYCQPGWFVTSNCTKGRIRNKATGCDPCRECETGQRTVSDCTPFSDTVCEDQVLNLTTPETVATTPGFPEAKSVPMVYTVSLYAVASAVLLLIVVAAVWKWRSAHKPSADPAREPFNIQKLRV